MFERFTQEAREVLVRAQEEARELRHNFIGTEHLLIGLEGTDAAAMLERLDAPMPVLRQAVLDVVGRGDQVPNAPPPFTPRAKKALELSLREALARDDKAIRPEHLLLGVARERDGVACQVLASAGITYDAIAAMVGPVQKQSHRFWRRAGASVGLAGQETPGALRAWTAARTMAKDQPVTTYHYLRALMGEGVAGQILQSLGVTEEAVEAKYREFGTAGTSDDVASLSIELEGENFRITPEQADQIRRYLAGGPPPLPPET